MNFALIQFLPGGPVEYFIAENRLGTTHEASRDLQTFFSKEAHDSETMEALRERFEFDKPLWQRFTDELIRLVTFQFGESYFYQKSVWELIQEKLPVSLSLGLIMFLFTYVLSIPLGILRAVKEGTYFDILSGLFVIVGYAIPSFSLGILLMTLFGGGSLWHVFPIRGLVSEEFSDLSLWGKFKDLSLHLCLPALSLSVGSMAFTSSLTRNQVLDQIKADYVRTARLKGVPEHWIILKHVLRNSALPLLNSFGTQFLGIFFTSSLMIESLFSLDGLGLLSYESLLHRDYPVVMANVYIFSLLYIFGNLISDILYVCLDPRIRFYR